MKQTSDSAQNGGASGTKVTSITVSKNVAASISPSGTKPSGSSQGTDRGKQGTK